MDAESLPSELRFLAAGSLAGQEILGHDWSASPLGPIEGWPTSLRALLSMMLACPTPMYLAWGPQLVSFYNDAYRPIFGARADRALGTPFPEIWSDLWETIGPFAEAALAGQPQSFHNLPLTMDHRGPAQESWWSFSYSAVYDESGRVAGMLCVTRETTRQLLAERALRESEAELRRTLELTPQVPWTADPGGRVTSISPRWLAWTGLSQEEALGEGWSRVVHPEDRETVLRGWTVSLASGEPYDVEHRIRLSDGRYAWMRSRAAPWRDPVGGKVLRWYGATEDVDEQVRAGQAQRESEERLQLALTAAGSIGSWDWDVPRNRVVADIRFARLYGVDPELAAAGAPLEAFFRNVHPGDIDRLRAAIAEALWTGGLLSEEYRLVPPDGGVRWVVAQGRCTLAADGTPLRLSGISLDISRRRGAEEALRRANEERSFLFALAERQRGVEEPVAILRLTAEALGERLAADRLGFYRRDPGGEASFGPGWAFGPLPAFPSRLPGGALGALAEARAQAGLPVVIADLRDDPAAAGSCLPAQAVLAAVDLPLRRGGRWEAGLAVHQAAPRRWTEEEVSLLEEAAQLTWDAVLRAEAQETLRRNEARFRGIANSIDQMVWSTRPDGYHDYYNERWYEYTGVPRGSTDGEAWNGMFHPEDRDRARRVWRRSLATGEPYRIEYRLRHCSGQYRWVLGRAQPVRDESGTVQRWFGTCTDIQEIVDAREVLARSREELERQVGQRTAELAELYARTPVALHSLDRERRLISVSDRWLSFMGYAARHEVLGRPLSDFLTPESDARFPEDWARLLREDALDDLPYRYVRKSGEVADVLVSTRLGRDAEGRPVRTMASVIDVSGRLRAEAERDRAEAALRQSQKMEALGQLTGGIAHDFNNMLAVVIGGLNLLRRRLERGDTQVGRYVDAAMEGATRAAALTQRLLAFSRQQPLAPEVIDVNALVRGMTELLRRSLGEAIRVETRLAGDLRPVRVDPVQLENAILNLSVNARDAMAQGGRLTIATANLTLAPGEDGIVPPGEYVLLCVQDTGTGMPPEVLAKAFDPFFTTKGVGKGTGLGLSQVFGFVRQSGGQVQIASEPGQGTAVRIYLPSSQAEAVPLPRHQPALPLRPGSASEVVLVVEDEDRVRAHSVEAVRELGYGVVSASGGAEALRLLETDAPVTLLFTDMVMPEMNGRALAEQALRLRPGLKVLFTTGYAGGPAGSAPGAGPGGNLLPKPFDIEQLAVKLREVLDG
ncbi:PAS domain-containing protein [Roseomonas sp. OT10]|uniref:PAS domain-containing protein n=1 Tax=Roseomonas cutis TaxID=2897332 RepID=UPI001E644C94|nr:PAS domain-containing protein [Roseomonas sp. OT10]UFN49987.1 PAS domain-containing protein [Roseomonas sp. OT10]